MHEDVLALANAEGAVCSLIFDRGVPPAIEVEDMVRFGQIQADATSPQRENKHRRFGLGILKLGNHPLPPCHTGPAVQIVRVVVLVMREIPLQLASNLCKLGEDQRALTAVNHLFDHLPKPLELEGTLGGESAAILQELRRVVADLLEFQKRDRKSTRLNSSHQIISY